MRGFWISTIAVTLILAGCTSRKKRQVIGEQNTSEDRTPAAQEAVAQVDKPLDDSPSDLIPDNDKPEATNPSRNPDPTTSQNANVTPSSGDAGQGGILSSILNALGGNNGADNGANNSDQGANQTGTPIGNDGVTPPSTTSNFNSTPGVASTVSTASEIGTGACQKNTVTRANIDSWISQSGQAAASEIFVYIDPRLLTGQKSAEANVARVGFLKALFSTSFESQIAGFQDISQNHCAVYKVNLQAVWGANWQRKWDIIKTQGGLSDPSFDKARQRFPRMSGQELQDLSRKIISAQRLAYNITFPTNYTRMVDSPSNVRNLQGMGRNLAIGGYENGIPCGPRVLVVRNININGTQQLIFLAGDPGSPGEPRSSLPNSPPRGGYYQTDFPRVASRRIAASETLHTLPNGFLRYFIFRNPGTIGTKALQSGVIDPGNPHNGYTLVTGRSCISCHNNGIRGAPMETYTRGNGWSDQATWENYFTQARNKYVGAMRAVVEKVSDASAEFNDRLINGRTREPVAYLISMVEGSSRYSRPYSSCNQAAGNKYSRQVADINAAIQSDLQSLVDNGTTQTQAGNGTDRSPTSGAPMTTGAPMTAGSNTTGGADTTTPTTPTSGAGDANALGRQVFQSSCATSGCHGASRDARIIKYKFQADPIPARMKGYIKGDRNSLNNYIQNGYQ